ncbi:MAG: Omp28-related outer membrane protein [Bacteroidota bacterium]
MKNFICCMSAMLILTFIAAQTGYTQNPRNILIQNLTSTNCGHCPCMDTVMEKVILKSHPNTLIIEIHGIMSKYENNDFFPLIDSLHYETSGAAQVNQMGVPSDIDEVVDTVNARYARMPQSPVKLEITSKEYNPGSREMTVVVKATAIKPGMQGQYRINAVLIESNLIGHQQHFPECPGGDDYNHKNVLRAMNFIPMGDILVNGTWEQDSAVTRTISMNVDEEWVDANCDMIIFIDKYQGALNVSEIQQAVKQGVARPLGLEPVTASPTAILSVFPNPVHGPVHVHIRMAESGQVSAALFDFSGKMVKTLTDQKLPAGFYNLEFDASDIPDGNYILRMESNNQVYTTKIKIQ